MKDTFIGLQQIENRIKNTECPKCGKLKLHYEEEMVGPQISLGITDLIAPSHLERYAECHECWNKFYINYDYDLENKRILKLELREYNE